MANRSVNVQPLVFERPGFAKSVKETILVVEDEPSLRTLMHLVLERDGYRVLEARNGEQAAALSDQYPYSIQMLVTDVMMPGMDGLHLAGHLLARRPDLKVLYISAYANREAAMGVRDGRTAFLAKPFTKDLLAKRIRELLDADAG